MDQLHGKECELPVLSCARLTGWLEGSVGQDPNVVTPVDVGLQSDIAASCELIIRTLLLCLTQQSSLQWCTFSGLHSCHQYRWHHLTTVKYVLAIVGGSEKLSPLTQSNKLLYLFVECAIIIQYREIPTLYQYRNNYVCTSCLLSHTIIIIIKGDVRA